MLNPAPSIPPAPTRGIVRESSASFGAIGEAGDGVGTEPDFIVIARSAEFRELRARLRRFVFPMSLLFFAWYLSYVIAAAYLPEFMSIRVMGELNIGLLLGVGQFVSTILITLAYLSFARRHIDPRVAALRAAVNSGISPYEQHPVGRAPVGRAAVAYRGGAR